MKDWGAAAQVPIHVLPWFVALVAMAAVAKATQMTMIKEAGVLIRSRRLACSSSTAVTGKRFMLAKVTIRWGVGKEGGP